MDVSANGKLYVVWLYDGFDNLWMPVSPAVDKEAAEAIWNEKTANGTKNTTYQDIDYYKVRED